MKCREIKEYLDSYSGVDISKKSREEVYIKFRAIYYFLSHKYATDSYSYNKIANLVNKDHASFLNGLKTFESFYISDDNFRVDFTKTENHVISKSSKMNQINIKRIEGLEIEQLRACLIKARMKISAHNKRISALKKQNKKQRLIINKLVS